MKKFASLLLIAVVSQCALGQNLLSNVSMQGSLTAGTTSGIDQYQAIGGPRGSHNHAWVPVTKQVTQNSVPLAFNSSTRLVASKGTYFAPGYTTSGIGSVTYSNTANSAIWSFDAQETASALPLLATHQWVNSSVTFTPRLYFTVQQDTDVTINIVGSANGGSNLYALSGEVIPSESGKPNTYTVVAGGTYCFWATLVTNGSTAGVQKNSLGATLSFAPVGG